MDDLNFDAFSRRAAEALHRRSVLGILGGAVLAALSPFAAVAKKGGGKGGKGKRKNGKKKGKKKKPCPDGKELQNACAFEFVANGTNSSHCQDFFNPDIRRECQDDAEKCCKHLANCKFGKASECLAKLQAKFPPGTQPE